MPAAALAGRTLLLATSDKLYVQDVMSGKELWQGAWPEAARAVAKSVEKDGEPWKGRGWTNRGVYLNDGQYRTLTVDWKGLAAGRDWVAPVGTRALVCLRAGGAGVESPHENGVSD
jgi:hypothetical protein